MSRKLTEKQVLKRLGIPDFRHLSKETIMQFASTLPDMDPEVAKKALEQFPDLANATLETMKDYRETALKVLEKDAEAGEHMLSVYDAIIASLQKMLEDGELDFEERKFLIEQMREVADEAKKEVAEGRKFKLQVLTIMGGVAVVGVGVLGAALGGQMQLGEKAQELLDSAMKK